MSQEARIFHENTFATSDGELLYFRHWPATEGNGKKVIVLFHRGHEHSGRLQHIVDELVMPDTHFYAWDARAMVSLRELVVTVRVWLALFRMWMSLFVSWQRTHRSALRIS